MRQRSPDSVIFNESMRGIAIFKPLHADALVCFVVAKLVQIGHEDLQTCLRSHASIAVHKLFLVVSKVEIEPRIIRHINHDEIYLTHGELSEVEGAVTKPQKIAPLLNMFHSIFSIPVN